MNSRFLTLHTARMVLSPLPPDRAEEVLAFYRRNQAYFKPWEPERDQGFFTVERQRRVLEKAWEAVEKKRGFLFWMRHGTDNTLVGCVNFFNVIREAFQSCLLGYKTDQANIGQGYMSEALAAGIQYMFGVEKLHRIEANIIPANTASLRVLEKRGFANEGRSRRYLKINGVWEDHLRMALLNE